MTGTTTTRLFVAVWLPPDVVSHLEAHLAPVRRQFPALRWVPPDRWHVTLTFLGAVDPERVGVLDARLARAAHRTPQHRTHLAHAGRFDQRVLWLGVAGERDVMRRLAERTAAAARRAGLEVEARSFRPHLTLARTAQPVDLRPAVAALADYSGPDWAVTSVALVRSTVGATARYQTVSSHDLRPH